MEISYCKLFHEKDYRFLPEPCLRSRLGMDIEIVIDNGDKLSCLERTTGSADSEGWNWECKNSQPQLLTPQAETILSSGFRRLSSVTDKQCNYCSEEQKENREVHPVRYYVLVTGLLTPWFHDPVIRNWSPKPGRLWSITILSVQEKPLRDHILKWKSHSTDRSLHNFLRNSSQGM